MCVCAYAWVVGIMCSASTTYFCVLHYWYISVYSCAEIIISDVCQNPLSFAFVSEFRYNGLAILIYLLLIHL